MALSDNAKGAALMGAAMAAFTVNDTAMKALSSEMPLMQALALRGALATVLLAGLALATAAASGAPRLHLPRRERGRIALRTVAEVAAAFFFLTALFHMPIANATAILQALPVAICLAGALFLNEPLGLRRLVAILAGLLGVLLIVQPGTEGFDLHGLYALAAVACVTVRDLVTRGMSAQVPVLWIAAVSAAGVALLGVVGGAAGGQGAAGWAPVSAQALGLLGVAGVALIGAYAFSVMTMRVGALAVVSAFRYTSLLWALLAGLVVFGEWPGPLALAGAALVFASGLATLYPGMAPEGRNP